MTDFYEQKAQKYKLKYEKLLQELKGGAFQQTLQQIKEKALVTELTNSTPEKAITILANIIDVEYIQKIYDAMPDQNIKYNYNQLEIVLKIMQERIFELYIHQVQNKNIGTHVQQLKNIKIVQQNINSAVTLLRTRFRTHEHTESELVTVENIMIELSHLLNQVNSDIEKANEALDVLKKGKQLYLVDIHNKQGIINLREKNIKTKLEIAQELVNKGKNIVMKIEQERQIQISKSQVGQQLIKNKLNRNLQSEQLKTRN